MTTTTTLRTATDRLGATVLIKYAPVLSHTNLLPLFLREFSKVMEKGWTMQTIPGANLHKVIYAEVNGQVAGFIIFEYLTDATKTTWILFGGVLEEFRHRNLYQLMHKELEKVAKNNGSKRINSFVHTENTAMLELNKRLGKVPVFHKVELEL